MKLTPVKSSNIAAIGYDPTAKLLQIKFHSGAKYQYAGVTPEHHAGFMASKSKGTHFRQLANKYMGVKV